MRFRDMCEYSTRCELVCEVLALLSLRYTLVLTARDVGLLCESPMTDIYTHSGSVEDKAVVARSIGYISSGFQDSIPCLFHLLIA